MRLIHIFYTVADDIVDDPLELLRICDDLGISGKKIGVIQLNVSGFQIHPDLFHAVSEIIGQIDSPEIIRDLIVINFGIDGELIDQLHHVVDLVINGPKVLLLLLRRVRDSVQKSLHISLNGCNRRLQIMRNVADELPVMLIVLQLLIRRLLQPQTHILIALIQLSDFSLFFRCQPVIQISVPNAAHCGLQLIDRIQNTGFDPADHQERSYHQNDHDHHSKCYDDTLRNHGRISRKDSPDDLKACNGQDQREETHNGKRYDQFSSK